MSLRAFLASYVLPKPLKCFISSWRLNRPMNRYLLHFPRGGLSFQSWIPSWPPFRASTVASFTCSVNRSHVHGILFDCANSRSAKLATKENFPENICIKDISRRENAINRKKIHIFSDQLGSAISNSWHEIIVLKKRADTLAQLSKFKSI